MSTSALLYPQERHSVETMKNDAEQWLGGFKKQGGDEVADQRVGEETEYTTSEYHPRMTTRVRSLKGNLSLGIRLCPDR